MVDDVASSSDGISSIDSAAQVYSTADSSYLTTNFRFTDGITGDGNPELLMPGAICNTADDPKGMFVAEVRTNVSGLRLFENSEYKLGCDSEEISYNWSNIRAAGDMNGDGRDEHFLAAIPATSEMGLHPEPSAPTIYVFFWP